MHVAIRSATSGEELVKLREDDLPETPSTSVRALKGLLAKHLHLPRFRQRLLTDDGELLDDDKQLEGLPVALQLVRLELWPSDEQRDWAFLEACAENRLTEVEEMLSGPQDPNTQIDDVTALRCAAESGSLGVVELLLEASADNESCDDFGSTPLHFAIVNGQCETARLLLRSRVDTEKCNKAGLVALHWATQRGHREAIRLLLESRADVDGQEGSTPLHSAALAGHLECAQLLLNSRADTERCDQEGRTPLLVACANGVFAIVKLLLESDADQSKRSLGGRTALDLAAENGHSKVLEFLEAKATQRMKRQELMRRVESYRPPKT